MEDSWLYPTSPLGSGNEQGHKTGQEGEPTVYPDWGTYARVNALIKWARIDFYVSIGRVYNKVTEVYPINDSWFRVTLANGNTVLMETRKTFLYMTLGHDSDFLL